MSSLLKALSNLNGWIMRAVLPGPYLPSSKTNVAECLLVVLWLITFSSPIAHAQTPMATIFGTVRDQTGAMLEGVQVEIREMSTQVVRSTVSGKSGTFVIPLLSPGRYRATASLSGFKKGIVEGLVLSVGDKAALNFVLQVGSVQESITVEAEVPLLQSESSWVGQVIDNRKITTLPLNEREFLQLALLGPGAAPRLPSRGFRRRATAVLM